MWRDLCYMYFNIKKTHKTLKDALEDIFPQSWVVAVAFFLVVYTIVTVYPLNADVHICSSKISGLCVLHGSILASRRNRQLLASVLIFSGWRAILAARKRLCEDSYVSTYLSASENPPMQRGQACMGVCLLSPKALHGFIRRYGEEGVSHSYG